jgi:thioredoxin-related protein
MLKLMSKTAILSLFLLSSLFGSEINWVSDFEEVKERAKAENRVIMVFVTKEHCAACERVETVTFQKYFIIEELNNYYISTTYHYRHLPDGVHSVSATPTIYFYTPSGQKIKYEIIGDMSYKKFFSVIRAIRKKLIK